MKPLDQLLTAIARDHLGIETLATRRSDDLDFHVVPVWGLRAALEAAHSGRCPIDPENGLRVTGGPRIRQGHAQAPPTGRGQRRRGRGSLVDRPVGLG